MKLLRIVGALLAALALVGIVAVGAAAWLVASEAGTGWLIAQATGRLAPLLSIDVVRGTLADTLVLEGVTVRLDGHEVGITRLSVTPELGALATGELRINSLDVGRVEYRAVPGTAAPDDSAFAGFGSPLAVVIERFTVAAIDVVLPDRRIGVGETRGAVALRGSDLAVDRFATTIDGFSVGGSLRAGLTATPSYSLVLAWSGSIDDIDLAGDLTAMGDWPRVELRHVLSAPFAAMTEGSVEIGDTLQFALDSEWRDARVPGFEFVSSASGRLGLSGTPDRIEFTGAGQLTAYERTAGFDAAGALAGAALTLDRLMLETAAGTVAAQGSADLDAQSWQLAVTGESLDPSAELPDWPGDLDAEVELTGRLTPSPTLLARDLALSGELRGRPLTARAAAVELDADGVWRVDAFEAESGRSRVTVNGAYGVDIDAQLTAQIDDLAAWQPMLAGRIEADLTLSGQPAAPRVAGRVAGTELRYDDIGIARAEFDGELGTALDAVIDAGIEVEGLTRGNIVVDSIAVDVDGTARAHRIDVVAGAPLWRAVSRAEGGLDAGAWLGRVTALDVEQDALGAWRLDNPVGVELGPARRRVDSACLEQGAARVCGELAMTGAADDRLRIEASDFDLRALAPFLPPGFTAEGRYMLSASFENLGAAPSGSLTIAGTPTTVSVALDGGQPVTTTLDSVDVSAELADWRLRVDAGIDGLETARAALGVDIADLRSPQTPIDGRLTILWQDLAPLLLLSPDIGSVEGSVAVELGFGGTRDAPTVEGSAEWRDGAVGVPAWGTLIADIAATASSRAGRSLDLEATGRAGDGNLRLSGTLALDPAAGWPITATLEGDQLRAVQLPNAELIVSPDLTVDAALPAIGVTGSMLIPRARLALDELPEQAVTPSPDAVVHREDGDEDAPVRPLDLSAELTVSLGNDIRFTGSGLEAALSGDLNLRYRSGRPEEASGVLTLNGQYDAYGVELDIDDGTLLFTGPVDNPTLDVRATRVVDDVTVGILLTGPLRTPQTSIFSMPAMSEAEALSYLVLGRPLETSDDEETSALRSAAISMGLRQALPVVERIGRALGLDELTVQAGAVDAGALLAGKQLSENLYIRYRYGLFNRVGDLMLRYRINERFSIETRSGDQKSMDLLYTVEKD